MASKLRTSFIKFPITLLVLASVVSSLYLPAYAPKAQAFLGIGDFGVTVDIKALAERIVDGIARVAAQRMVDEMVKDTIEWANTGFEGNPAFVTDPGQYYGDIASGTLGDYISGSALGFVCSPFQAKIRLSLQKQYTQSYTPQCTLDQIGVNFDDFVGNFENGGWDAWFAVSQNPSNNPYGAFVTAKLDIDQRLASALNLKQNELEQSSGYLSYKECTTRNVEPPPETVEAWANGEDWANLEVEQLYPDWNPNLKDGECINYGPVKTPGTVIKSQLDRVLPSGLEKLITIEHADQLVGAFLNGLLTRYVFGPKGLFGDDYKDSYTGSSDSSMTSLPELQCSVNLDYATVNETLVRWTVASSLPKNTEYTWIGDELVSPSDPGTAATGTSVSVYYKNPGPKTAYISASTTDANGNPKKLSVACESRVEVSKFRQLQVACYPGQTSAQSREPVEWIAKISGGSGRFETIQWGGGQDYVPKQNTSDWRMWPSDIADPNQPFVAWLYGGNGGKTSTDAGYKDDAVAYGLSKQKLDIDPVTGIITSTAERIYIPDGFGNVDAFITVIDEDSSLPVVSELKCNGSIFVKSTDYVAPK